MPCTFICPSIHTLLPILYLYIIGCRWSGFSRTVETQCKAVTCGSIGPILTRRAFLFEATEDHIIGIKIQHGQAQRFERKKHKIVNTTQSNMQPQNPQDLSLFFQELPDEIRLEIYSHVFYSTRLSFGKRFGASATGTYITLRPASKSLSLLLVCRQINSEIGHSWIGQILLSFEDAETMLGKLSALEPSVLTKLRYMRISGSPPSLWLGSDTETIRHGWAHMLKVWPGLCLHRLTIVGDVSCLSDLSSLSELIAHSEGWKELYYLTHNSAILECTNQMRRPLKRAAGRHRTPRVLTFNSKLVSCDGPTASVSIYRSIHAAEHGLMISKPAAREAFPGRASEPCDEHGGGQIEAPTKYEEMRKDVLFVARRGNRVDYAVKPGSSLVPYDTREVKIWRPSQWQGICCDSKVDIYKHVDDYEWTPEHDLVARADDKFIRS